MVQDNTAITKDLYHIMRKIKFEGIPDTNSKRQWQYCSVKTISPLPLHTEYETCLTLNYITK